MAKAEATEPTANWWRWITHAALENQTEAWADLLGFKTAKALDEWVDKAKPEQLRAVLVATVVMGEPSGYDAPFIQYEGGLVASIPDACDFYGINHKKIVEDKQTEARVLAKAEAEKARLKEQNAKAEADAKDHKPAAAKK